MQYFQVKDTQKQNIQALTSLRNESILMTGEIKMLKENLSSCQNQLFQAQGELQRIKEKDHLCFNITEKGHMIVLDWYNRILDYTRKYCKNSVFQCKWQENQIQYCLVVDFKYFVANLTRWYFLKWPKTAFFWIRFSVLEHYAITVLRVAHHGSA